MSTVATASGRSTVVGKLDKKRAIVTGAGAGLGRAIALGFAQEGAHVVAISLERSELESVKTEASKSGLRITTHVADVGDARRSHEIATLAGPVDIVVNNAGVIVTKPVEETTADDWHRILRTNLEGAFIYTKAFLPNLVENEGGLVINVSSESGTIGFACESAYCASKFGLEGLTQALAIELRPRRIGLITVIPGAPIRTPMSEQTYNFEERKNWVDPTHLVPGFLALSVADPLVVSGNQFSAWDLSRNGSVE